MFCEKCGAKNDDDALFCLTCGAKLDGSDDKKVDTAVDEDAETMPLDAASSEQTPAESATPAEGVEFDPETGEVVSTEKKKSPVGKIVKGVVGAVVVVGVIAVGGNFVKSVLTKGASTYYKHAIIYMKDGEELAVRRNGKKTSYTIDEYDYTPSVKVTKDGKTMFILNTEDDKLYYRSVDSEKAKKNESSEGTLIAKNVSGFLIQEDGDYVLYNKDGKLCYNDLKDEQVISKNSGDFLGISEDGKKVAFKNDDGDVEVATLGKKITSEVVIKSKDLEAGDNGKSFIKYSRNFDEFLYVGNDKLYYKNGSKDAEQIAKDVVAANMLDGTIYYVVDGTETKTLGDYIDDDCKAADEKISRPSGSSYGSRRNSDWSDYYDKQARDNIRDDYFDNEIEVTKYKLCSYSGGTETVVDEQASSDFYIHHVNSAQSASTTAAFPEVTGGVLMYAKNGDEPNTVKLSDYDDDNYYRISSDIRYGDDDSDDSDDVYAVIGGTTYEVEDIEDPSEFDVIGGKVYAIVDSEVDEDNYYNKYGELVSFDIGKGLTNKQTVAEDVVTDHFYYMNAEEDEDRSNPVYFVGSKDEIGILKGGKYTTVDNSVEEDEYRFATYKDGAVYYLTDYNSSKGYGDLMYFKNGKSEKIGTDVGSFIARGNDVVVYIADYDSKHGTGTLCKKTGTGKENVIDEDVSAILY